MKNSTVVTAWLDRVEEQRKALFAAIATHTVEALQAHFAAYPVEADDDLGWQACLDAGWTIAELDEAIIRRLNLSQEEADRLRAMRAGRNP